MISKNVVILTTDELQFEKDVAFNKGVERGKFEAQGINRSNYTKSGCGIIDSVTKMFRNGTYVLDLGDALGPVQEAYQEYIKYRDVDL